MFADGGRPAHTSEAFPCLIDDRLALFTVDGRAVFRDTAVREFTV
jgi:levanbiose-producing levanase